MKIIVETDNHITGTEKLREEFTTKVEGTFRKFETHITTIQVNLSDENASKSGPNDKKCSLEVRLKGEQPVVVTEYAGTLRDSLQGALKKGSRTVKNTIEKKQTHR